MERLSSSKWRTKSILWGYSSVGRAPALQAGGQRFDPANLHQRKRLKEAATKVEVSLSLFEIQQSNQTNQKPNEVGFDWRGETAQWSAVFGKRKSDWRKRSETNADFDEDAPWKLNIMKLWCNYEKATVKEKIFRVKDTILAKETSFESLHNSKG